MTDSPTKPRMSTQHSDAIASMLLHSTELHSVRASNVPCQLSFGSRITHYHISSTVRYWFSITHCSLKTFWPSYFTPFVINTLTYGIILFMILYRIMCEYLTHFNPLTDFMTRFQYYFYLWEKLNLNHWQEHTFGNHKN